MSRNINYRAGLHFLLNYIFDSKTSYLPLETEHFQESLLRGNNIMPNFLLKKIKQLKEIIWLRYIFYKFKSESAKNKKI